MSLNIEGIYSTLNKVEARRYYTLSKSGYELAMTEKGLNIPLIDSEARLRDFMEGTEEGERRVAILFHDVLSEAKTSPIRHPYAVCCEYYDGEPHLYVFHNLEHILEPRYSIKDIKVVMPSASRGDAYISHFGYALHDAEVLLKGEPIKMYSGDPYRFYRGRLHFDLPEACQALDVKAYQAQCIDAMSAASQRIEAELEEMALFCTVS